MIRKVLFVGCLLVLIAAPHANAQRFVALGMPDSEVLADLTKFQKAIAAGDRATVASMVNYPLRVNRGARDHTLMATRGELLKRYDAVFTPDVRHVIVTTNLADVLGGMDGVPLGRGVAWFTSTCSTERPRKCRISLTSINQNSNK
jgi:hypothetical protein